MLLWKYSENYSDIEIMLPVSIGIDYSRALEEGASISSLLLETQSIVQAFVKITGGIYIFFG